jgi:cyclopropane-fatty-acyl-phospholipid synthase
VKHWRERFAKNRTQAVAICDERFCRMWEFYLAAVELEFLHGSHMVFQLLLSTKRDAVPITRDFMIDGERAACATMAQSGRLSRRAGQPA